MNVSDAAVVACRSASKAVKVFKRWSLMNNWRSRRAKGVLVRASLVYSPGCRRKKNAMAAMSAKA